MTETLMRIDDVRIVKHRNSYGSCIELAKSIGTEGLHRPVCVWKDGTLISGERRVFAHLLLEKPRIQAVSVDTIEDAAKQLRLDLEADRLAVPQKWSEICKLWQTLRRLDEPAAAVRLDANRRLGVELRRLTQAGKRAPGRTRSRSRDYVLEVLCEPWGVSSASGYRVEQVYRAATGLTEVSDERRELSREILAGFDEGDPIWPGFERWRGEIPPRATHARPNPPADPAPAAKQMAAWARTLPQLEGLITGLIELGPIHPDLTWAELGPVHTQLAAARRELDRIIRQMKEKSE